MTEIFSLTCDPVYFVARGGKGFFCGFQRGPVIPCPAGHVFKPTECVQRIAMIVRVEKSMAGKLTFDFDQGFADAPQHPRADGLIVDEGAAPTIAGQCAAKNKWLAGFRNFDIVFGETRQRHMTFRKVERRRDDGLRSRVRSARTKEESARAPIASPSASRRIDLPAPVSPVRTHSPSSNSMFSLSIRTKFRIESDASIACQNSQFHVREKKPFSSGRSRKSDPAATA